jgi:DNA invertase Pin-like site-specific DNA recombinase
LKDIKPLIYGGCHYPWQQVVRQRYTPITPEMEAAVLELYQSNTLITQIQIARQIGISRTSVGNIIRDYKLNEK